MTGAGHPINLQPRADGRPLSATDFSVIPPVRLERCAGQFGLWLACYWEWNNANPDDQLWAVGRSPNEAHARFLDHWFAEQRKRERIH